MSHNEIPKDLVVNRLTENEFAHLQAEWQRLLGSSGADPLFMSWAWLYSWWEVWAEPYGLELVLLGVYERSTGQLVGLAPLYRHEVRSLAAIKIRRLHFIGNAWRIGPSVRTEYVGLIALSGCEINVALSISRYLRELVWDELVISDSRDRTAGDFGEALVQDGDTLSLIRSEAKGVRIHTNGSFDQWMRQLGRNTRLKAINRQTFFEDDLKGKCQPYEPDADGYSGFFEYLNRFHYQRWGKPCFDERAVDFHLRLLARLDGGQSPQLSQLISGNEIVSVLYDIRVGGRIYNLQSGFDEALHKKLSLGTLHLGYAIRRAFGECDVDCYDLLAGYGKNTFYKAKFKGEQVAFTTVEFVRSPLLKLAYRFQASLPHELRRRINRILRL